MEKLGVIIANTGSPAEPTPAAVRTYLQEFLTDPRICPMNPVLWNALLRTVILPRRSKRSAEKYQQIWTPEGSPLKACMAALARKLEDVLVATGKECAVRCAMSYGEPGMIEALRDLRSLGCTQLIAIPLYPQSAFSTTKVVQDKLESALTVLEWQPSIAVIESYFDRATYLDAIANSIAQAGFGPNDALLMAFHSIPLQDIASGDTYDEQAKSSAWAIAQRLGLDDERWMIGFQSRFDKSRKWLGPSTIEAVKSLDASTEYERLFVVAPNFSIDCLETLYDIDIVLRGRLQELWQSPEQNSRRSRGFRYVPCLNDSPAQVELLASLVN